MTQKLSLPLFSVQPLFSIKNSNTESLSFTKNENIYQYFRKREEEQDNQNTNSLKVRTGKYFAVHVESNESSSTSLVASDDIPDDATTLLSHDFSKPLSTKKRTSIHDSFLYESEVLGFAPLWQIQNVETKECVFATGRDPLESICQSEHQKRVYQDSSKFSIELLAHVPVHSTEPQKGHNFIMEANDGKSFGVLFSSKENIENYIADLKQTLETHVQRLKDKEEDHSNSHAVDIEEVEEHVQHMNINDDEQDTAEDEASSTGPTVASTQAQPSQKNSPVPEGNTEEAEDIVPLEEDMEEIETQLQGIRDSNAHIDTIATHLNELVSLTRREVNKKLLFQMQAMDLLLSLLQTQWKENTTKIILPILSIMANIALSQTHKHLAKLLDQEGVMEQVWLVLKLHIKDVTLVRNCLLSINLIGSQDGVMPFFAKHPTELVILFSLVNTQNAHNDMRLVLLVLQATAASADYSAKANQKAIFQLMNPSMLNQIFEFMQLFEYNQRLVLSAFEIIERTATMKVHQIDFGKFGEATTRCILNFRRDSMVLSSVLRALSAVNPQHPLECMDAETRTLLRNQAEILVKRDSADNRPETHCITAQLYDSVFSRSQPEKQE
uniref:Uncharacterized protein n=1 Tax=Percolomonas cosmopolitus TaxID=63605 RepID=A0A7S1KNZ0_9EUKA|mmetsp:Transcript_3309/g.12580  ORF Transcript_3309/g.12580 Transcript_3309/m.12580 type:complete len:611 (+) Transcript_3309:995-2827(+)